MRGGYLLALGLLGDVGALAPLQHELTQAANSSTRGAAADRCPWVRVQALRALARFGDAAIDLLHERLQFDGLADVQRAAGIALGGLRSPRVSRLLAAVASDTTASTAARAGAALGLGCHFRRQDPRLPRLRFQQHHEQLPALVAWATQQDLLRRQQLPDFPLAKHGPRRCSRCPKCHVAKT